ncbi:hypothetical protein C2E23DRAFT_392749 [Lenzites betulinus]|nr:hypothetical protein C2E23DRAFT_392749 [Lenzites betulinus]
MPKEPKAPLFCCGAEHKSANYHKRTVHQKHTKIIFKGHPKDSFVLRRNPVTSHFHCPKCTCSWAMATPIRMHIFTRCEGYAQFRTEASANAAEESVSDISMMSSQGDTTNGSIAKPSTKAKSTAKQSGGNVSDQNRDPNPQSSISNVASSSKVPQIGNLEPPSPLSPDPISSPEEIRNQVRSMPPVLRPAVWSPVKNTRAVGPPLALSTAPSESLAPLPVPTRSASSCSSRSSAHTLAGDPPPVARTTHTVTMRFKSDPDGPPDDPLPHPPARPGACLASPPSMQQLSERPTAIRTFLNNLRRPLGHAAPLFYKMGLVDEEDLALICTMPEAWDEVGSVLQVGGLTTIEWMMVRQAFKGKARGMVM